jgi:tetratricopeptide (TPR) repeat protein
MNLTIEQALNKAIEAHKVGSLQEAEAIYRAILQSKPDHPHANHNLGVLAVSLNKTTEALEFFRTALQVNPSQGQFWLSYVDALIKVKQFEYAKQILEQGKKLGLNGDKVVALEKQLILTYPKKDLELEKNGDSKNLLNEREKSLINIRENNSSASNESKISSLNSAVNTLIQHYQKRQYELAEKLAKSLTHKYPTHQFSWKLLGIVFKENGKLLESLDACKKAVDLMPKDAEAHNNLGITLEEIGSLQDAEKSYKKAILLNSNFPQFHNNLGNVLKKLNKLEEADACYRKAIVLNPSYAEAYMNLASALQTQGGLNDAEKFCRKAILLNPNLAQAHNNLGCILKELGSLTDAEMCFRKSIELFPNFVEAHINLGNTRKEAGNLKQAKDSLEKAITLMPNHAEAHGDLGSLLMDAGDLEGALVMIKRGLAFDSKIWSLHYHLAAYYYAVGEIDLALESMSAAISLVSKNIESRNCNIAYKAISKDKKKIINLQESFDTSSAKLNSSAGLATEYLILNRPVENELIQYLYKMTFRNLEDTTDARFGNGKCSKDFNIFSDESSIIKSVSEDLIQICKANLNGDVLIADSFFNINRSGGGTKPHEHIGYQDKYFNLASRKFSLVYYLDVGDQSCTEPGILRLYKPDDFILPTKGMMVIIKSDKSHSSLYNGNADRVLIGVNFYCL